MKRILFLILCMALLLGGQAEASWFKADGILGPFSVVDSSGAVINPATEDKQDVSIGNQTDGDQKTQLVDPAGANYTVQNPVPTDGDSGYAKDIWISESSMNTFSGSVTDLFDDLHSIVVDSTANNPKEIFIHFNRSIPTTVLGLGAFSGDFSNLKVTALASGMVEVVLLDDSADATKLTTKQINIPASGFNALKLEFYTADTVTLSNLFIVKAISTASRIIGQKPDGDFIEFQSTASGNFKVSLEEFENAVSVNSNTQLRVTSFDSAGAEVLGTVTDSPTENTVLERLKVLETLALDGSQKTQVVDPDGDGYINDPMLTLCAGRKVKISEATYVNKFGRNPDVNTGTDPEDIWSVGGLWVPPAAAIQHDIFSSDVDDVGTLRVTGTADSGSSTTQLTDAAGDFVNNAVVAGDIVINDTNFDHATVISRDSPTQLTVEKSVHSIDPSHSGAGNFGFNEGDTYRVVGADDTGASLAHIIGLDINMAAEQEFIILNGQNDVTTIELYYRIFRMHIDGAAGRSDTNEGNIRAEQDATVTVTLEIPAGEGQSLMAIYTIPKGKIGCMTKWYAGINKVAGQTTGTANIALYETPTASVDGAGQREKHFSSVAQNGTSNYNHPFRPYKKILDNTDMVLRAEEVSNNGSDLSGGFDIILVDN